MARGDFDLIIESGGSRLGYWKDLWQYRELLYFLAWRDVVVRYKQTVIGVAWSVFKPFLTMLVLTFIFGKLGRFPSGNTPYAVMVLAGLLPWQFFSGALNDGSNSLVANAAMLTKVYFPRLIIPASTVVVSLIDFLISFVMLGLLMVWYRVPPTRHLLAVPVLLFLVLILALGCSCALAALTVRYRDFRFIVPFIIQFGMYLSPVGFASTIVPEKWRLVYSLNPVVGIIDGFRWAVIGDQALYWPALGLSIGMTGLLLAAGVWYFRHTERDFADVI